MQACNPLGGVESCMTLPSDSRFAQICPGHDLKVRSSSLISACSAATPCWHKSFMPMLHFFSHTPRFPASTGPQCSQVVICIANAAVVCNQKQKHKHKQATAFHNHTLHHSLASTWRRVYQVDCAYYSDDLLEVNLDPGKELKDLLEARGLQGLEASCPECFQNQRKLVSTACSIHSFALLLQLL